MGHIKAPQVDWFRMGWVIGDTLDGMPSGPPGLLAAASKWPIDAKAKKSIELLQDLIAAHLTYRVFVRHGVGLRSDDGPKRMLDFWVREPSQLKSVRAFAQKLGVKFSTGEQAALTVHALLGRILIEHFVPPDWKWQIPLFTASISDVSASEVATQRAIKKRNVDRRSSLARTVADERNRDRHATAAEVLDRLCGGDVVKEFKDNRVWYWDDSGRLRSVGLDRFETIFSEQVSKGRHAALR